MAAIMKRHFSQTGWLLGLRFLAPRWQLPAFALLGVTGGMGLFVFHISRAASYLSDAPETCMNCHVMTTQYVTWQHSSHAEVATCNDCHVPHDFAGGQYALQGQGRAVARHGLHHAMGAAGDPALEAGPCRWSRTTAAAAMREVIGRCVAGRPPAGRPALLGVPSRGAARLGPQPVGHARRLPAAAARSPPADSRTDDRRTP